MLWSKSLNFERARYFKYHEATTSMMIKFEEELN